MQGWPGKKPEQHQCGAATAPYPEGKQEGGFPLPRRWGGRVATPTRRGEKAAGSLSLSAVLVSKFSISPTLFFSEKNKT